MIVRGESTIIDYHAPFDQGFMCKFCKVNQLTRFVALILHVTDPFVSGLLFLRVFFTKKRKKRLMTLKKVYLRRLIFNVLTKIRNIQADFGKPNQPCSGTMGIVFM